MQSQYSSGRSRVVAARWPLSSSASVMIQIFLSRRLRGCRHAIAGSRLSGPSLFDSSIFGSDNAPIPSEHGRARNVQRGLPRLAPALREAAGVATTWPNLNNGFFTAITSFSRSILRWTALPMPNSGYDLKEFDHCDRHVEPAHRLVAHDEPASPQRRANSSGNLVNCRSPHLSCSERLPQARPSRADPKGRFVQPLIEAVPARSRLM